MRKHHSLYPENTMYGLWTTADEIHIILGFAYQNIGDYKSALAHLKMASELFDPKRSDPQDESYYEVIIGNIESIESGTPLYAPLSEIKYLNEKELDEYTIEFNKHIDQVMDKYMRELYPVSD